MLMLVLSGSVLADSAADKNTGYKILTLNDVTRLMKKEGFFSKCYDWNRAYCNPKGDFANNYKGETLQGQPVVLDRKSGLMWHRGGTYKSMRFKDAEAWIAELNRSGYAGFKDWRFPTLREAATLLENRRKNGSLYIDAVFSKEQGWIWTGDLCSSSGGWVVTFSGGTVAKPGHGLYYVRPVRSL